MEDYLSNLNNSQIKTIDESVISGIIIIIYLEIMFIACLLGDVYWCKRNNTEDNQNKEN